MKYIELQYAFELEIANLDVYEDKIPSQDILYWLNQGADRFVKTRYSGNNPSNTGFEQDEKRARDLMSLYTEIEFSVHNKTSKIGYDEYSYVYPNNLLFVLDEYVAIENAEDSYEVVPTEVFECTLDNYMYRVTNKLTDFHYHNNYARPLRIRSNDGSKLLTDGNYNINSYKIGYIRKPAPITLDNPFDEYTDFPEYVHNEIVKLAVQMYIENSKDPRYESIQKEISSME